MHFQASELFIIIKTTGCISVYCITGYCSVHSIGSGFAMGEEMMKK